MEEGLFILEYIKKLTVVVDPAHRYKMSLAEKEKKESKDTKAQDKVDNNSK